jgi:hypothetical protein
MRDFDCALGASSSSYEIGISAVDNYLRRPSAIHQRYRKPVLRSQPLVFAHWSISVLVGGGYVDAALEYLFQDNVHDRLLALL